MVQGVAVPSRGYLHAPRMGLLPEHVHQLRGPHTGNVPGQRCGVRQGTSVSDSPERRQFDDQDFDLQ